MIYSSLMSCVPLFSLYLHIPFCRHRCAYCDFNTYAGLADLIPAYGEALCREIDRFRRKPALPVHTIYLGGGTPSLLPQETLAQIFQAIQAAFALQASAEISMEANPGTVTLPYLRDLRRLGVNRLSLGMQTAHPAELRLLERQHDYPDVIRAVRWARQAGFDNLSLDLIFGIPGQTLQSWQWSLELALGLAPEHLSLYSLTIEPGTPLARWEGRGLLPALEADLALDLAADMYELASERLEAAGYAQYEISNWARQQPAAPPALTPAFACRHNLQYWRNQPYLGLGAGAHGYAGGLRLANVLRPQEYIRRLAQTSLVEQPFPLSPANETITPIERQAEMGETMMMGLRLALEGVSDAAFRARFGQGLREVYASPIEYLVGVGLLEWAAGGDLLRLTRRGHLLGNVVFREFI